MPGGASKLRDVRKLSDARAILDSDIALMEMPGLPEPLVAGGGPLHARVLFGREQGHMMACVELSGELQLICQRCMGVLHWPVATSSPVLLIESESAADDAPVEWETVLAPDGRVSLARLATEELLLALPIVPLHPDRAQCAAGLPGADSVPLRQSAERVATRPFADLRALMKQGAKPKN